MSNHSKQRTLVNLSIGIVIAIISIVLLILWEKKSGPQKVEVVNQDWAKDDTIVAVIKFDSVNVPKTNNSSQSDDFVPNQKEDPKSEIKRPAGDSTNDKAENAKTNVSEPIQKTELKKEVNNSARPDGVSKDPNCKEKNTGDYCFQNNTNQPLKITLTASPTIVPTSGNTSYSYNVPFSCTINPGQKQCFFDVPTGRADYEIHSLVLYRGYRNPNTPEIPIPAPYNEEGSLYVEICQEKIFIIK